jgi:hypothetical protein
MNFNPFHYLQKLMSSNLDLPHRHRLDSVKSYEVVIAEAVRRYPNLVMFDPAPRTLSTFSARLRDAMFSLYKYQWTGIAVDMEKFNKVYEDLVVSERVVESGGTKKGMCVVGSKDLIKTPIFTSAYELPKPGQLVVTLVNDSVVRALCVLCENKILPENMLPVKLLGEISPEVIAQLEVLHAVAFEKTDDGYLLL